MNHHQKSSMEHYEASPSQCWPHKAIALNRFKRHLPKRHFDGYKNKYGSVSAQSTGAIYGALRGPHCHAVYGPTNIWYASVRSLNRDWRETFYEDANTKEIYAVVPPVGICACMMRKRHSKCKHSYSSDPKKTSEKLKTPIIEGAVLNTEPQYITSRMSGYRKCVSGNSKFKTLFLKGFSSKNSNKTPRKSILECDVTAYDLIRKVANAPSIAEIDDSDIDDNLSDNAIVKLSQARWQNLKMKSSCNGSQQQIVNKNFFSKFKKSQSENCIYSESHSVLVGGQRIFTDSHRAKSKDVTELQQHIDDNDVCKSDQTKWRKLCSSDETICIPDPDYDSSDDGDETSKFQDHKFTYSPPIYRKPNLGSRNISKSMSSLLSDDTCVPNINVDSEIENDCDNTECRNPLNVKQESKYESFSDCSSSEGTLSSDYPTWTSSSSNELKSILKKKNTSRQELETVVFHTPISIKDSHRKKQVQFQQSLLENISIHDNHISTEAQVTIPEIHCSYPRVLEFGSAENLSQPNELNTKDVCLKRSISFEDFRRSLDDDPVLRRSFSSQTVPKSVFYVPIEKNISESFSNTKLEKDLDQTEPVLVSPSTDEIEKLTIADEESIKICDVDVSISPDNSDTDDDFLDNDYEHLDPIYEELSDVSTSSKIGLTSVQNTQKSFFEGASKIDILSYLADAKERGLSGGIAEETILEVPKIFSGGEEDKRTTKSESLLKIEEEEEIADTRGGGEVERNDSGVGTETSKPWECADCDTLIVQDEELLCRKCEFRRGERKEIIFEFVDTELKYGRDLRIIKEEFYRPMEIAGLLAKDQLFSIFLNLDELITANTKFAEKLQDALDIATEHGDEDYTTVNLGKIFLEESSMLHAYETYCVKQALASVLLSGLEKEKELLRIFLRVSQMENTLLRRMNLPAFLMVPVQRVTRYPLLLSRLHKVTPSHHKDRSALKEAQQKVELHLEHINQQTKGIGGMRIWRRISNISASRRLGKDIGNIKLRKMALEILNWKQDETRFVLAGKVLFTQVTDYPWNKKGKTIKFAPVHALLIALGKPNSNYRPECSSADNAIMFSKNTGIRDASLVLMKEKNGRFVIVREPLYLGNCVISCDSDCNDVFEVQEYTTKEAFLLKGDTKKDTKEWLRQLKYHAKDLGSWRRRRNALANIMIIGMIRQ